MKLAQASFWTPLPLSTVPWVLAQAVLGPSGGSGLQSLATASRTVQGSQLAPGLLPGLGKAEL